MVNVHVPNKYGERINNRFDLNKEISKYNI